VSTHSVCLRDADAYAKGGIAKSAQKVKQSGRYGDDVVVHMNHDELNQLRQMWGEPTVNPETGMPEFFLSGLQSWLKDNPWVAPVASTLGASVLGPLAGSALGAIGVPASYAGILGGGLAGAGIGALTGGGIKGAITGGALGATVSPYIGNWLSGTGLGQSLGMGTSSTVGDLFSKGSSGAGIASNGLRSEGAMDAAKGSGGSGFFSSLTGGGSGTSGAGSYLAPLLLGSMALGSLGGKQKGYNPTTAQTQPQTQPGYGSHLQPVDFSRKNVSGDIPEVDYYTYGQRPAKQFFTGNQLPTVQPYAAGGGVAGDVTQDPFVGVVHTPATAGSDGRADNINALLSEGEYVMDAETVSMLGNGSTDAGAAVLDQMRENLRKDKGSALAQGKISKPAQAPESYLPGAP
jgi:hypothetical protein